MIKPQWASEPRASTSPRQVFGQVSCIIASIDLDHVFIFVYCRNAHPYFFFFFHLVFLYVDKAFGNFCHSPLSLSVSWPFAIVHLCDVWERGFYERAFEILRRREKAHGELTVHLKHMGTTEGPHILNDATQWKCVDILSLPTNNLRESFKCSMTRSRVLCLRE